MMANDPRPLVAHVVYRFDVGGLENGVVNLINRMPVERFRHAVIALTEITEFRKRVERDDVEFVALRKGAGHGIWLTPRIYRLLRSLAPAITHTRNLAALEATLPAWLARVPVRVHGEHGWDVADLTGTNRRHRFFRKAYRPFVTHYVALSRDIERYLGRRIGVADEAVSQIYNGVDTARFSPAVGGRAPIEGSPFNDRGLWVLGTVGRLQAVKDQAMLARAFVRALEIDPKARARLRLVIVGEGALRIEIEKALTDAGLRDLAWLPGERRDIPQMLRGFDGFALPSLSEGISNTILEAMSTGLPIVATRVGGNGELLEDGMTGRLVPSRNVASMADAILGYYHDPATARRHGRAARLVAEKRFSLERMVADYASMYERLLARTRPDVASRTANSSSQPTR